ncbi:aldose epimerase family protein [Microvirga antarctica]|uniref:aldose epimerase family protein n=1 Tax=Microvirga antarctica TaxID=2819233 RepID=UPI0031BB9B64
MIRPFGSVDDVDISEVGLVGPDGMEMQVLTWGAVIRDLVVPAKGGVQRVLLGLTSIEDYVRHSPYFGAIVGRYANRIGRARFSLDGHTDVLDANEGRNQLHGGSRGFGTRPWAILDYEPARVTLGLLSRDGDMGYPGRLLATCTYTLLAPATLRIELTATSDKPTPVNLTSHAYFNLDGSADICSHQLMIAGDFITPTDADLIPTGAIKSVEETPFDFRTLRPIGAVQLLHNRLSYDVNYVLRGPPGSLAHASTLASLKSGVAMELWTTEPGLQFYGGHMIDVPVSGLGGRPYGPYAGLCLEPQRFPDGPNKAHFPSTILIPGMTSRQTSEYRFALM